MNITSNVTRQENKVKYTIEVDGITTTKKSKVEYKHAIVVKHPILNWTIVNLSSRKDLAENEALKQEKVYNKSDILIVEFKEETK
jgi:hypothetical protein